MHEHLAAAAQTKDHEQTTDVESELEPRTTDPKIILELNEFMDSITDGDIVQEAKSAWNTKT